MPLYRLRKDKLFLSDYGVFSSYGIDILDSMTNDLLRSVPDISLEREPVESLVWLCNHLHLDMIHLDDVITDFLS